jgi:hypothetical protein
VDRRIFIVLIIAGVAIVITVITGFFVLLGPLYFYYGYPFPWRLDYCPTANAYGCPPFYWWAFVEDVLLYAALESGLFLGYARYHAR